MSLIHVAGVFFNKPQSLLPFEALAKEGRNNCRESNLKNNYSVPTATPSRIRGRFVPTLSRTLGKIGVTGTIRKNT